MKKFLLVCLPLYLLVTSGNAQIINSLKDVVMPTHSSLVKSLDGEWDFYFINGTVWEEQRNFPQPDYDISGWDKIAVPGCWDALGYTIPKYANPDNLNGLYRKSFLVPKAWKGKHLFLNLEGVQRGYEVWVNGHYVGKWESAYNTCRFDITNYLRSGENLLALRVYTRFKGFDFDTNDDWGQVGINRSVSIFAVPDVHIKDFTLRTEEVSVEKANICMLFDVASFNQSLPEDTYVAGKIKNPQGQIVATFKEPISAETHQLKKEIVLEEPLLWNAETPHLYELDYTLCAPKQVQHFVQKFGVREIKVVKNTVTLNGKKIKFRGVNLHETDPFHGKVVSEELNLKDLKMMKEANINLIRCSHYPRDSRFYELCDSIGMYVMSEVPFGYGDHQLTDTTFRDILLTRADATVRRDKNHASILFWSIGNENPLTPITEETGRYVKRLDATRPICYPMMHKYFLSLDFNIPEFVDILTPHYPIIPALRYYLEASRRPILFTEYAHSLGQSFEHHKELWELIEQHDKLLGGCVWEWVDQGMVDTKSVFPGRYAHTENLWLKEDTTSIMMKGNAGTDGMLYANRVPLSNYYELRRNYAQAFLLSKELVGRKGDNRFTIEIANRFDFVDLKDKVFFEWILKDGFKQLATGRGTCQCPPRSASRLPLDISLPEDPADRFYQLELNVYTHEGYAIGNYVLPVVSEQGTLASGLFYMTKQQPVLTDVASLRKQQAGWFQEFPLLRAGRKYSLSEELRAKGRAVDNYLLVPENLSQSLDGMANVQTADYRNAGIAASGCFTYQALLADGVAMEYAFTDLTPGKLLLEGGVAFLLNKEYTHFQWMGYGPYATYPGKQSANSYGLHEMCVGDLYFEGNRMGIDAMACMDHDGNGFLLIAPQSNINLEQTDRGVVLSLNAVVSGLCSKFRPTAFPVYTDDVEQLQGKVFFFPLVGGHWPESVDAFFKQPAAFKPAVNPFLNVYDTYLLKYEDICGTP